MGIENMGELKKCEAEIKTNIKNVIKKYSYKGIRGHNIFKNINEHFVSAYYNGYHDDDTYVLHVELGIKKMSYDNLLWEILDMESNKKEPLSLRVIGAFTAPFLEIGKFKYEINNDNEVINVLERMIEDVEGTVMAFISSEDLNSRIINNPINMWKYECLKTLAYIDSQNYNAAILFLKSELELGEKGTFIIGEESFNQLALRYCNEKLNLGNG